MVLKNEKGGDKFLFSLSETAIPSHHRATIQDFGGALWRKPERLYCHQEVRQRAGNLTHQGLQVRPALSPAASTGYCSSSHNSWVPRKENHWPHWSVQGDSNERCPTVQGLRGLQGVIHWHQAKHREEALATIAMDRLSLGYFPKIQVGKTQRKDRHHLIQEEVWVEMTEEVRLRVVGLR